MKVLIHALYIFCVCGTFGLSMNMNSDAQNINPEEISDFFEGDMILTPAQILDIRGGRNGLRAKDYRWPHNTVKYRIFPHNFSKKS